MIPAINSKIYHTGNRMFGIVRNNKGMEGLIYVEFPEFSMYCLPEQLEFIPAV